MQIKPRKIELQTPETIDENIGKWCMSNFLKILTEEERTMISLRYDRRRKRSWNQVARILSKSESQCHRDLQNIKQIYRKSVFAYQPVDNSEYQKYASF